MRTIRQHVFETNSSSCHCLTIMKPSVYDAIKDQKSVIHDKYSPDEYGDIQVLLRKSDLIAVDDLYTDFIDSLDSKANEKYFQFYIAELERYWTGLYDAFMSNIRDITFFKKLVYFDDNNPGFEFDVKQASKVDDLYDGSLKNQTHQWIAAWVFRNLCTYFDLDFISFSPSFEDLNVSITDFEYDVNHDCTWSAEHNISC